MSSKWIYWCALIAVLAIMGPRSGTLLASTNSLTVIVKDLRSDSGTVRIGLWNEAEGFPERDTRISGDDKPARLGATEFVFENLVPGRYALIAYHDENDNGEFDRTLIGWPEEGLGFSNDAWIDLFGAPSFEETAIDLVAPGGTTVISMRY